ncbi:related to alcohol dehydrogenase II [Phialocephala subalpina]|uniref:Related to alcohol dehydrogenase II n=1 Tax=Phialocephala subalpina TaxID=576137 RepID=A0A1L7XT36_9HELO|nr:related to alcohol dehydrogenase II [Phialocephala subalpina]
MSSLPCRVRSGVTCYAADEATANPDITGWGPRVSHRGGLGVRDDCPNARSPKRLGFKAQKMGRFWRMIIIRPDPGPGEVLINLCVHFRWSMSLKRRSHDGSCEFGPKWKALVVPAAADQVGGHEGVGTVVKLRPGAETTSIKVGDRVVVQWIASACSRGGTFQQFTLGPANDVTPTPDGLDSASAAPLLCARVTVYSALLKSQTKPGDWVVVSDAGGGLGHLAVQIGARVLGLRIIGIDHASKVDLFKELGTKNFVDITQFPRDDEGAAITAYVKSLTDGLGASGVIVCTAADVAYSQAVPFLRFNVTNQYRINGSSVGNQQEAIEVLGFAARGLVKAHYQIENMENLTKVSEDMRDGKVQGRVMLNLS